MNGLTQNGMMLALVATGLAVLFGFIYGIMIFARGSQTTLAKLAAANVLEPCLTIGLLVLVVSSADNENRIQALVLPFFSLTFLLLAPFFVSVAPCQKNILNGLRLFGLARWGNTLAIWTSAGIIKDDAVIADFIGLGTVVLCLNVIWLVSQSKSIISQPPSQ